MVRLFPLPAGPVPNPSVDAWLAAQPPPLAVLAAPWLARMRGCGPDVTETLHDGMPTGCVAGCAFAYLGAFRAHVNLGFFAGSTLPDPLGLLEGTGRFMRHVKLRPEVARDEAALAALLQAAYTQVRAAATAR